MATAATTSEEKTEELIDALTEKAAPREQRIAFKNEEMQIEFDKTYIQKPLSFFGKLEFGKFVGTALKEVVGGEDGVSVDDIFGLSGATAQDMSNADFMLRGIMQLSVHVPDLLKQIFMLSLNVPSYEQPVVELILDQPHDEETGLGGLSDEDGVAILNTFVAQNAKAIADFFRVQVPALVKSVQESIGNAQTPASSKPSKRSARTTG
jgi:hypothetical protein